MPSRSLSDGTLKELVKYSRIWIQVEPFSWQEREHYYPYDRRDVSYRTRKEEFGSAQKYLHVFFFVKGIEGT